MKGGLPAWLTMLVNPATEPQRIPGPNLAEAAALGTNVVPRAIMKRTKPIEMRPTASCTAASLT